MITQQNPTLLLSLSFVKKYPQDAASVMEKQPPNEVAALLSQWPLVITAPVVQAMTSQAAAFHMEKMAPEKVADLLELLSVEAAADILRRMPPNPQQAVLEALTVDHAKIVRRLLTCADNSVASIMDPHVFTLPAAVTVGEARRLVQAQPQHVRYYLYVVDIDDKPVGVLTLQKLAATDAKTFVRQVMKTPVVSLSSEDKMTDILMSPYWERYFELPVTNPRGTLVGRVRYDMIKTLERKMMSNRLSLNTLMNTMFAMGELYWMGLSGMLIEKSANKNVVLDRNLPAQTPENAL